MTPGEIAGGVSTVVAAVVGAISTLRAERRGREKERAEAAKDHSSAAQIDADARAKEWSAIIQSQREASDRERQQHTQLVVQMQAALQTQVTAAASWRVYSERLKAEVLEEQRSVAAAERARAEAERIVREQSAVIADQREQIRALQAGHAPPPGETTADMTRRRPSDQPTGDLIGPVKTPKR